MIKQSLSITNILLITAIVFFGVRLFYDVVEARLDAATLAASFKADANRGADNQNQSSGARNRDVQFSAYTAITERDLFKTEKQAVEEKPIEPTELEKLQKTQMNLKLWGTITGTGEKSYAVIEDAARREQQLYQEGDSIQQARIKMILRKKVVLTVNGKDEILEMEELVDPSHRVSASAEDDTPGPDAYGGSEDTVSIEREEITDALQNINSLMRQIRIRPYFEDGKPSGILLSGIRSNSIFEEMGLQSGDVVRGVNGKEIQSVDDALKFYENLKSSSEVELQIQRNGEQQTIYYRID